MHNTNACVEAINGISGSLVPLVGDEVTASLYRPSKSTTTCAINTLKWYPAFTAATILPNTIAMVNEKGEAVQTVEVLYLPTQTYYEFVSYSQPVDATPGACTHTEAHVAAPKTVAICKASTGEQCRADNKCTFNPITAVDNAVRNDDLWYRHPERRLRHAEAIQSSAAASDTIGGCATACLATTSFRCRSFDFYNDKCWLNPGVYGANNALAVEAAAGTLHYEWVSSSEAPVDSPS